MRTAAAGGGGCAQTPSHYQKYSWLPLLLTPAPSTTKTNNSICELYDACFPPVEEDGDHHRLLSSDGDGSWSVVRPPPTQPPLLLSPPPGASVPAPPPRQHFEAQRRWQLALAAHADAYLAASAALALASYGATATQRASFHVGALRLPSVFEVVSGAAGPEDEHDLAGAAAARLAGEQALAEELGVPRSVALAALAARPTGRATAGSGAPPTLGPLPSSSKPRLVSN